MAINVTKPSVNLREKLNELQNQPKYDEQQFWFAADGSLVAFTLDRGWKPKHVFNAGLLQKEGSGDEYVTSQTDGLYIVTFNVAPANLNDIGVIATREGL